MTNLSIRLLSLLLIIFWGASLFMFIIHPNNNFSILNQNFLINYSSGFIRRGLLGEIIKRLYNFSPFNILNFIKYFCLVFYLFISSFLLLKFIKQSKSIILLLMPYVLPYYSFIGYIIIRDFFLLTLFLVSVYVLKIINNKIIKLTFLNLITIIGILTHEAYFFFSVPVLIVITTIIGKQFNSIEFLHNSIAFIPSIFTLSASIYYHGSTESVTIIYNDVIKILPKNTYNTELNGGIASLSSNSFFQIKYMFQELLWNGFSRGISYLFFFITILFLLLNSEKLNFSFSSKRTAPINSNYITFFFLIQTISFLPIFIVAIDWQRWISISIYSSFIIIAIFKTSELEISDFIMHLLDKIRAFLSKFILNDSSTIYLLLFFCIIPYFKLGNTPYQFSNIYIIIHNYLSKIVSIL